MYLYANKLGISWFFSDKENKDEVKPLLKNQNNIQNESQKAIFSNYHSYEKNMLTQDLNLEQYLDYLKENLSPGNPNVLIGLEICIPNKTILNFVHAYDEKKQRHTACFLDFAQLNLHEFCHAIAYMMGECINPHSVALPSDLLYVYSNAEELRNISLSKYSENIMDEEGPQRISHKSVHTTNIETFRPSWIYCRYDTFYFAVEDGVIKNQKAFELIIQPNLNLLENHEKICDINKIIDFQCEDEISIIANKNAFFYQKNSVTFNSENEKINTNKYCPFPCQIL